MSSTFFGSDFSGALTDFRRRQKKPFRAAAKPPRSRALEWLRERIAGLRTPKAPPLQLEFTDRFVRFKSMKEFEFALACRTEFPAPRVRDLMALTPPELERLATRIRDTERRFAAILARAAIEPALTSEFFREIHLKLFSHDHGWRDIMESLMRLSPTHDEYKRLALIKYMQYLRARQNIMRSVFVEKTRGDTNACVHATRALPDDGVEHGDTDIFNRAPASGHAHPAKRFASLPKGETVCLDLGDAREAELLLAGNRFRLYTGHECYMVDDGNNTFALRPAKNLVGRHSGCDVVVDPACRSVSRNHLLVEPVSAGRVLLTDLSSHGTEVPAALLRPR
jgi:hypothetical protein